MKNGIGRASLVALGAWLATPMALWAHPGHPWIEGAAQPMLGLDHFLAFMLMVVGITAGVIAAAKRRTSGEKIGRRP